MGRGDSRTTKGKRFKGSYGKKRPRKEKDKASAGTAA
ncbi:MAG: 30S ribosomal protein THX [Chitinispirillaceae bacterium]|nr:30S ribosomal protein THX [Chitinispirillaceae bacterium]